MKRERMFKLVIVLITGTILFAMSANVFAATDPDTQIDFFQDISDKNVTSGNTANEATGNNVATDNTNNTTNTSNKANTTNTNNYNTSLPKAGMAENTMAGVAITVLAITAIYAYRKVNEYKNI